MLLSWIILILLNKIYRINYVYKIIDVTFYRNITLNK